MYSKEVSKVIQGSKPLSEDAERDALLSGNREAVVEGNYKLVASIAGKYYHNDFTADDFFMYGVKGLILAVESYDVSRIGEVRFATFAQWLIQKECAEAIRDNGGVIRVPANVQSKNRENAKKGEEVESLKVVSFDKELGETGTLHDVFGESEDTAGRIEREDMMRAIMEMDLSEIERGILVHRYGLDDGECETNTEVGERYGKTGERIRQMEMKLLVHIRKHLSK
jgi:RNA polymerase primary sigma factor